MCPEMISAAGTYFSLLGPPDTSLKAKVSENSSFFPFQLPKGKSQPHPAAESYGAPDKDRA